MIKIDENYTDYRDDTDPKYPAGKAVNASTEEGVDGTPILADWMNDVNGFRQAAFMAAFGGFATLSGVPDDVFKSDTLNAINKITQTYTDKEILKEAKERLGKDAEVLAAANNFTLTAVGKEKGERVLADEQILSSAKSFATDKDKEVFAGARTYTDEHANDKNNPHEVTGEQVGLGKVYNISQIGFGVCNTEAAVQAKSVVVENIVLIVGARLTIKFKNGIATDSPTLNVNGTGAKPITMDSQPVGKGCFDAGGCYEFVYTGDSWECLSGMVRTKDFGESSGYVKYRNGLILQEMLVYINVSGKSQASQNFLLPIAFSRRFSVFSCGQSTQANTCAFAHGLDKVRAGIHWDYHEASNCGIYIFAIGF